MRKRMIRKKMKVTKVTFMAVCLDDGVTYVDEMELPFIYKNNRTLEKDLRENFDTDRRKVVIIQDIHESVRYLKFDPKKFLEYAEEE